MYQMPDIAKGCFQRRYKQSEPEIKSEKEECGILPSRNLFVKPYYISLLNAAELYGAAHQRPQRFTVMTVYPSTNVSKTKNNILNWVHRKEIPENFLQTKNSETVTVTY